LGTDDLIKFLLPVFSVFSPYASRRKADSSMSPTSTALLSTHSSSVQETASETPQTPSSAHNQAQIPGRQNEAHTSDPENQAVISDPLAKEKNPPKDIEEIRKAAEAAVEELEKLGQLKETTKKNFELLRLAEQQAIKELARTQKQLEEAVGVHHAGKVCVLLPLFCCISHVTIFVYLIPLFIFPFFYSL
jgi:predicted lipid-binding transport protein (Tim44 family)